MSDHFIIPDDLLATLKATPAGRSGVGGYNYQHAYAVARLAASGTELCVSSREIIFREKGEKELRLRRVWQ